jgi:hypothetical protein
MDKNVQIHVFEIMPETFIKVSMVNQERSLYHCKIDISLSDKKTIITNKDTTAIYFLYREYAISYISCKVKKRMIT